MSVITDIPAAFSDELVKVVAGNPRVIVVDADLADSCQTEPVAKKYPGQSVDIGVAEQTLPTLSAGLALMGRIPIYNTFSVFATGRGFEMLRVSVAYNRANVKIVGHAAGLSLGYAGPTHHGLEDIALMRSLPGLVVLSPADGIECRQMLHWMVDHDGPVYLRLSRGAVPDVHAKDWRFQCGVPEVLAEGEDVVLITTGDVCILGLQARERLIQAGLSARVVNLSSLKPAIPDSILEVIAGARGVVTIEDHSIIGGLGSVVAEILAEAGGPRLQRVGIRDRFTESDDCAVLRDHYGLSLSEICSAAQAVSSSMHAADRVP